VTRDQLRALVREQVRRSRLDQGKPENVTDARLLFELAGLVGGEADGTG
jgi:hypothetical protein